MGSCLGASLEVLERSTGTSSLGCLAGLEGLFCGTELRPNEGLRMLSIEKERHLVGEDRIEDETASSSVGVGGGDDLWLQLSNE